VQNDHKGPPPPVHLIPLFFYMSVAQIRIEDATTSMGRSYCGHKASDNVPGLGKLRRALKTKSFNPPTQVSFPE